MAIASIFSMSYLGFSYTSNTHKVAGVKITVSKLMLGTTSTAYCNEAMFAGEFNAGVCTAAMDRPNAECLNVVSNTHNCVLH